MKKKHLGLVAVLLIPVVAVLIIGNSKGISPKKIDKTGNSIPDTVMVIFHNSCMQCHGEGGKSIAMLIVNFSLWDTYSVKKQADKADDICNAITDGIMPPASVQKSAPEKIPTSKQIEIVCKWASSLKIK
jgi:hypothetical protein